MSYFSTRKGSIIGAGRLSFRVRDGSGRFPTAVAAVTLFTHFRVPPPRVGGEVFLVVGCGLFDIVDMRGCERVAVLTFSLVGLCVSFRPVSASSLRPLLVF